MGGKMQEALSRCLNRARAAIIANETDDALVELRRFEKQLLRAKLSDSDKQMLNRRVSQLAALARAAQQGADEARAEIAEMIEAAKSLRTYDPAGRRNVSQTTMQEVRRY